MLIFILGLSFSAVSGNVTMHDGVKSDRQEQEACDTAIARSYPSLSQQLSLLEQSQPQTERRRVLTNCNVEQGARISPSTTAIDDICGVQTTTPPTPPNSLVWQAARFAANQVYYGNDFQIKALGSPAGTPLHNGDDALNRNNVALGVHYNSFVSGEIKGCIYSSNDIDLRNKIFIAFRGTQSMRCSTPQTPKTAIGAIFDINPKMAVARNASGLGV